MKAMSSRMTSGRGAKRCPVCTMTSTGCWVLACTRNSAPVTSTAAKASRTSSTPRPVGGFGSALTRLGAGHAGVDDAPRALLKYHGDAQVAADLEAVRLRQCHQKLPGGQRPYGLANLLLGRHLVEEVDDGIDCHHLGEAVAAKGNWSGADQVKHRIDQAGRHTVGRPPISRWDVRPSHWAASSRPAAPRPTAAGERWTLEIR